MNLQPAKNKQGVRRWFAGPPLRWQSQFWSQKIPLSFGFLKCLPFSLRRFLYIFFTFVGCHSACYGKKITLIAVVGFPPSYLGREILISRKVSVNRGITSISHQGGSPYYGKRIVRGRWWSWVIFWLVGKRVERERRFGRFSSSEN